MKVSKHIAIGAIGLSLGLLFGATKVDAATAIVDVKSLYLREKPTTSSDMVDGLVRGQELEVLEELEDWYKVKIDGKTGYVSSRYVKVKEEKKEETKTEETTTETETKEEKQEENKTEETNNENNTTEENKNTEKNKKQVVVKKEFEIKEGTLVSSAKAYILPLINTNILKELDEGTTVTIYDEAGNWYYIQDDEIAGWILKSALGEELVVKEKQQTEEVKEEKQEETKTEEKAKETETETETKEENKTEETEFEKKKMYVNSSSVFVRKGPGTNYEDIDGLVLNDEVTVVGESGDWYKIDLNGKEGYVAKRLLSEKEQGTTSRNSEERSNEEEVKTSTPSTKGEEIVEFAKQYLNCEYVYGGSGPDTFDCSGFTMFVYKEFGVNLSHSATAQSKVGEYVAKEDLMPGDLVFFKDYQTMDGIGHCGIYIGDGNFIHASSGTGYCVKISTLLSGSYNTRYETARRIF